MMGATLAFLAVAVADLVAGGLKGIPASGRRAWAGIASAAAVVFAGATLVGWTAALAMVSVVILAAVAAWVLLRVRAQPEVQRAWGSLAALIVALGVGVGSEGWWRMPPIDWLGDWLESLAFPALNMMEASSLFLVVTLFLFLAATTNGIVRAVLVAAGTETERSEARLRGGRVIGVLERWMIFALMLAGEPTAAGLVVSAKSILRFPELSNAANRSTDDPSSPARTVDHVTEYFLLGSLVSWLVAAILALLFVGPF